MKVYFDEDGWKIFIDTMAYCKKQQRTRETCHLLLLLLFVAVLARNGIMMHFKKRRKKIIQINKNLDNPPTRTGPSFSHSLISR